MLLFDAQAKKMFANAFAGYIYLRLLAHPC